MLDNVTEELVREVLNEYKKKDPICECSRCEDDIVAMVLNELPPRYFLSGDGPGDRVAFLLNHKLRFEALIRITEKVPIVFQRNHG